MYLEISGIMVEARLHYISELWLNVLSFLRRKKTHTIQNNTKIELRCRKNFMKKVWSSILVLTISPFSIIITNYYNLLIKKIFDLYISLVKIIFTPPINYN